jgi:hypothetical protein
VTHSGVSGDVCIFCLGHRGNVAASCTYGLQHEFPNKEVKKQVAKRDAQLCIRCGLHAKNPTSRTSECAHEYV